MFSSKLSNKKIIQVYFLTTFFSYLIFWLFKYQLGFFDTVWIFFYDTTDHFADTLKIIFSFSHIFSQENLINLNVPEQWINWNPYEGIVYGNATPAMSLPPLTIIFLDLSARLSKIIGFDYRMILIIHILLILYWLFRVYSKNSNTVLNYAIVITSYPFIFLIDRGNTMAGISAICLFIVIKNFIYEKNLNFFDLTLFIIACSIRPNYLIFGLLFLINKTLRNSFLEFLKVGLSYIFSNFVFFMLATNLLPNYSFSNFRLMVSVYFIDHTSFAIWNSSLYGAIFNIYRFMFQYLELFNYPSISNILDRVVYSYKLLDLITLFFALLILYSFRKLLINQISRISFVLLLVSITMLDTHPIADYHLVLCVLVFTLLLDLNNLGDYSKHLILISLVLIPKVHLNSPNINFSNFVNSTALILLILLILFQREKNTDIN